MARRKFRKIRKNSLASGTSLPNTPGGIEFSVIPRLLPKSSQKIHAFLEVINFFNFPLQILSNFVKNFLASGASAPRTPL